MLVPNFLSGLVISERDDYFTKLGLSSSLTSLYRRLKIRLMRSLSNSSSSIYTLFLNYFNNEYLVVMKGLGYKKKYLKDRVTIFAL